MRVSDVNTGNVNGHFLSGVGVARLEEHEPHIFVCVAVRDFPIVHCEDHSNKAMTLRRTRTGTTSNPRGQLFYVCEEEVCEFNSYVVYPMINFQMAIQNGIDEPILTSIDGLLLPSIDVP